MLKNLTKDELIELVYSKEVEINELNNTSKDHETLFKIIASISTFRDKSISWHKRLYNLIIVPFLFFKQLKQYENIFFNYKLNHLEMTQDQILQALEQVKLYEAKQIAKDDYLSYIETVIGVKTCRTCGSNTKRLHNDFHRRLLSIIKSKYSYLAEPIKLVGSKYGSDFFNTSIPYYTFYYLDDLVLKMKRDISTFTKRGFTAAAKEVEADLKTLSEYVTLRKAVGADGNVETPVVKTPVDETPVDDEADKDAPSALFVEGDESIDWAKGIAMRDEGTHLKTISVDLGVPYRGLSQALKDYESTMPNNS